jgi:tetratricopeptide (TPR) repeat protein
MMRRALFVLLAVHGLPASADTPPAASVTAALSGVVTVRAIDIEDRIAGEGSGVVVARATVITNCHVIRYAKSISVNDGKKTHSARRTLGDVERDLCRLEVDTLDAPAVTQRAGATLAIGDRVHAIGNPLGLGVSVSSGLVSNLLTGDSAPIIVVSASLSPGSSGGGLFDDQGRLVGITTGTMVAGQNTNIALPSEWITDLARTGTPPPPPFVVPEAEPRWAEEAERLRDSRDMAALAEWASRWIDALPDASEAWRLRGLARMNLGRYDEAERDQLRALELHERNAAAWVELGDVRFTGKRPAEASAALARAREILPFSGYSHRVEGRWRMQQGDAQAANALAQQAVKRSPNDDDAWALLAESHDALGRPAEAARAWRIALRHQPEQVSWSAALARSLKAAGQTDQARAVLSTASSGSENVATLIALAHESLAQSRYTEAEQALRKALAIAPASNDAAAPLGAILMDSGRAEEGRKMIDAVLARDPDHREAQLSLARHLANTGDRAGAAKLRQRVVARHPDDVAALRELNQVQSQLGDWPGALASARSLVRLPGATAPDQIALSEAALRAGLVDEARTALTRAEAAAPEGLEVLLARCAQYGREQDHARSLEYATRATKLHPTAGPAWSSKGYVLILLGRPAEAVEALEVAVRLDPQTVNGWINLGHALMLKREVGRAIEVLERAEQLAPESPDGQFFLGQAYGQNRQFAKGIAVLDRLTARYPGFLNAWHVKALVHANARDAAGLRSSYLGLRQQNVAAAQSLRNDILTKMPDFAAAVSDP